MSQFGREASGGINTFYGAPREEVPWPACQACQFLALWVALAALLGMYVWEIADSSVRMAAAECSLGAVHLGLVAAALLLAIVVMAQRTRAWVVEVKGRNRREERVDDSTVFAADYLSRPSDGVMGSLWAGGDDVRSPLFGDDDSSDASRRRCPCSGTCLRWSVMAPVLLLLVWHAVAFFLLLWAGGAVDLGELPTDASEPSSMSFRGITDAVTVEWEATGMVHIRAQSEPDLFFGQGYVASRMRLWQMEYQRKMVAGRLAELVGGDDALATDTLVRTLGLPAASAAMLTHLDAGTTAAVEAYTKGVNAYLEDLRKGTRDQPVEFLVFGVSASSVEAWTNVDSIAWLKLLQFDLGSNLEQELQRYSLLQRSVSLGRIQEFIPPYNEECPAGSGANATCSDRGTYFPDVLRPTDCPQCAGECCPPWQQPPPLGSSSRSAATERARSSNGLLVAQLRRMQQQLLQQRGGNLSSAAVPSTLLSSSFGVLGRKLMLGGRQNNWVVDGKYTSTGKPLLANDLQLSSAAPSAWLLMHLECPTYNAIGSAFAGVPFVIIGRNKNIAWGMTQAGADVQDMYVLTEASDGYTLDGTTKAFETRKEMIKIRGSKSEEITIRESIFGPVVTDVIGKSYRGPPLALQWTVIEKATQDTTLNGFRALGAAADWAAFRAALALFVAPASNFVFADSVTGDIGYVMAGKVPIRANAEHTGEYPVPGISSTAYAWSGFIEAEQKPRSLAPPEGYIVSANNRATPPNYPLAITRDWSSGSEGYRARRISKLITDRIASGGKVSVADMKAFQLDTISGLAEDLKPLWESLPSSTLSGAGRRWQEQLSSWNMEMSVGSLPASVFSAWVDELSKLAESETGQPSWDNTAFVRTAYLSGDSTCGGSVSACAAAAARALNRATIASGEHWGEDVNTKKFSGIGLDATVFSCLVEREASLGGDGTSVGLDSSYRQVIDLDDAAQSWFITVPGQSGSPFSEWYDNLLPDWEDGDYLKMATTVGGEGGYTVARTQTLNPEAPSA